MQARWDDPGNWQRFQVVAGAPGGSSGGDSVALVAHTGCFLEVNLPPTFFESPRWPSQIRVNQEHPLFFKFRTLSNDLHGPKTFPAGEGSGEPSMAAESSVRCECQRSTEYGPRAPTAAQSFVLVPLPRDTATAPSEGVAVALRSADGLWLLGTAFGE